MATSNNTRFKNNNLVCGKTGHKKFLGDGGVFPGLVGEASFLDRISLSVRGERKLLIKPPVEVRQNFPIAGKGSFYARSLHAVNTASGNPLELKYGRRQFFRNVPKLRLGLRSQATPLTKDEVATSANCLLRAGFRAQVTLVEVTFDTSEFSIPFFRQHLFTRATRQIELQDDYGRVTLYVGGPTSPWQARIYQKRDDVVRFEFILRLGFLRQHGITLPEHLGKLRDLDLWSLIRLQEVKQERLQSMLAQVPAGWRKRLLLGWPRRRPLQILDKILRKEWALDTSDLFRVSPAERTLRRMQRRLIW